LHLVEGELQAPRLPLTPGHQVVAEVAAAGEGSRLAAGARVGVPWLGWACGACAFCHRGQENLCREACFTGFHRDGGFAEYLTADADFLLHIPEGISDEAAAPLLCAGIIGYRSLRRADLAPGETLGLIGFGASAHLALPVARAWGCRVFVFTRGESHRKLALRLGAAWAGGIEEEAPAELDRAVLFAPAGELVPLILERLRPGGTLAINAIHLSPIPRLPYGLLYGERTIRSVSNATRQDGRDFLRLAAELDLRPTLATYALEDANRALADLRHSRLDAAAVLLP
jgi:propanol-preferring alcohol dehydrogenase